MSSTIGSIGAVVARQRARASRCARRRASGDQRVAPPTSMYSMNRTSALTDSPVLDQIDQLVVVDAADDDRVDLQAAEDAVRGGDARRARASSSSKRVSAVKRSRCSVSRLTVMRPRPGGLRARRSDRRAGRRWSSARGPSGPAWRRACATSAGRSRRSSGSPPVSRTGRRRAR